MNVVDGISRETVRRALKNDLKPHLTRCRRIPAEKSGDFVCPMEDVLDVCQRKFGEDEVSACTAEALRKRTKEIRTALPTVPGRPVRFDCEYERNGMANLFMVHAPLSGQGTSRSPTAGRRKISPDSSGTSPMFTSPAKKSVLGMGNLNTHKPGSLYCAFPPDQAGRICDRFEVHCTPKYGTRLNIAESGISVLSRQRLSRRIPDRETLCREVSAWQKARNADPAPVKQRFTAQDAHIKLHSL